MCMTCSHYMRCLKKWLCNTRRSKFGFLEGFYPPTSLKPMAQHLIGSHLCVEPTKEKNKLIFPILRVKSPLQLLSLCEEELIYTNDRCLSWVDVLYSCLNNLKWMVDHCWGASLMLEKWKHGVNRWETSVGGILLAWYAVHATWDSPVTSSIYDCSICSSHPYSSYICCSIVLQPKVTSPRHPGM